MFDDTFFNEANDFINNEKIEIIHFMGNLSVYKRYIIFKTIDFG